MPRFKIAVRPYRCSARPKAKWVLSVWYPTGKRQRRYFETMEAALAEQAVKRVEVENLGLRGLEISDRREAARLHALGYPLSITAATVERLIRDGYHPTLGACPLRNTIKRFLQDQVRSTILGQNESSSDRSACLRPGGEIELRLTLSSLH